MAEKVTIYQFWFCLRMPDFFLVGLLRLMIFNKLFSMNMLPLYVLIFSFFHLFN